jgi:cell division protein FtsQ
MRSLSLVRKSRNNPRAKTKRKTARGGRELAPVQPGSARKSRPARAFSRPMVWLAAASVILATLMVLAVSGIAGRTVNRARNAASATVANAGFGVYEIQINGNRRVPTQSIFAALGLTPGQSIFDVNLRNARARIMALDWIASADVVRRYPDTVTVTVTEKKPFALWQSPTLGNGSGGVAVVERAGGVITTQGIDAFTRLPKLIGPGAPGHAADLVGAVQAHRAISARIAAYERVSDRRWNLILNAGVVVKLPETGWQKQLDDLESLIVDKSILEKSVVEIDLRAPTHYFFVLKGGEQKNVERGKET